MQPPPHVNPTAALSAVAVPTSRTLGCPMHVQMPPLSMCHPKSSVPAHGFMLRCRPEYHPVCREGTAVALPGLCPLCFVTFLSPPDLSACTKPAIPELGAALTASPCSMQRAEPGTGLGMPWEGCGDTPKAMPRVRGWPEGAVGCDVPIPSMAPLCDAAAEAGERCCGNGAAVQWMLRGRARVALWHLML